MEIRVANASVLEGQAIPEAPCFIDLSGSNLPHYLIGGDYIAEEVEEPSHSTDSNSENAPGNDYGNTPSSSAHITSSDDEFRETSEDDEQEKKMKKLMRLMDKNKPTDSDEEDYDDSKRRKNKNYVSVAQDVWYNRDDDYDDNY